ncbi:MAG: VOC family protein [Acidobacteriaceae bacterium]
MNKIIPFLWFDNNAEAAADFYLTLFPAGRKLREVRCNEAGPLPVGSLLVLELELNGQEVTFLNGGPGHPLTDAFSFTVRCANQPEIDHFWSALTADGGSEIACGWLRDKFGLCWQIVPEGIYNLIQDPAAMRSMMSMKKLDLPTLEKAAAE